MFYSFLVSDVIYTSRAYATMSVSICLWRKCTVVTVDAGKRRGDAIATARPSCTCEMIISLKHLPYMERLKQLKLPTLKYRRLRGDMIEVYKSLAVASIARDVESSSTNRSSDIMHFTKIKKMPNVNNVILNRCCTCMATLLSLTLYYISSNQNETTLFHYQQLQ